MNIYLDTIGCRLNQSEIETYARQFRSAGHTLVSDPAEADLAVINTCTVTAPAAADSRKKIRLVARAGCANTIVTGCWSTLEPSRARALPGVSQVIPNREKETLVHRVLDIPQESLDQEPISREPIPGARSRTRAFIKVQDGCNNRCTFCVTTLARGQSRSRTTAAVMADIQAAVQGDVKEVVLTGVHLGSWGKDNPSNQTLKDLVGTILQDTDLPRLRLSSLEPWDLEEDFFSLWENPRLARHLHLPLQSGCAATLKRMARKTTPKAFTRLMETARGAIPNLAITTDVIVGFPGEDETEFAESLAFVKEMNFSRGHVFTYSARPGTAAAEMPDQVPHAIRKDRNLQMRGVLAETANAYQTRFLGQRLGVLWESATMLEPDGWALSGLTDNYLRVTTQTKKRLWNQITTVRLTRLTDRGLIGQIG